MSFLDKVTAFLPLGKKEEKLEYFFALNIGVEKLTAALWAIDGGELKIVETASDKYASHEEIIGSLDRLLDQVLGLKEIEPQKILFGVPASWLSDDSLKDEYLKLLRGIVKELELAPMAYVATSHALVHLLEKQEGVPTTAILVGFDEHHLTVTVVRAGKIDGTKIIGRGENSGSDIEKALLTFTDIETLPSKILIYGSQAAELKSKLSSFSWMSKLSFLHFPKIEALGDEIEIGSVCFAGGSEINSNIKFTQRSLHSASVKSTLLSKPEPAEEKTHLPVDVKDDKVDLDTDNLGFVVGDVSEQAKSQLETDQPSTKGESTAESEQPLVEDTPEEGVNEMMVPDEFTLEVDDFEKDLTPPAHPLEHQPKQGFNIKKFMPKRLPKFSMLLAAGIVVLFITAYLYFLKADVKVFVEPKVLEKDTQVVADPNQKGVDEAGKIIPGQIVDVDISGSAKDTATGKKQIGDPAKGTVVIINNTAGGQNFSAGTILTSSGGVKFKLDNTASVSATLADSTSKSTVTVSATAVAIGADGNIPSETKLIIGSFATDQFVGKAQGNFSGGTSKDVTVVSSDDQQRLLAKLSSDLRQQAQQKLQDKYPNKKILQEALSENIISKSYNKNINDQASDFSLNMTVKYKGTAFDDADLRTIVSKLVNMQVPDGFQLDISATETQADVSKLEKDGKLIFLARFKAKLIPKIDTDKIRHQIKFKTVTDVANMLKGMDNVLGSDIKLTPNLPAPFNRLPVFSKNITIEVGLK